MKDNCQREITYLRLSVTDLCNLRCRYCMPAEGVAKKQHSEICSVEELAAWSGRRRGTVSAALFRLRQDLQEHLEREGFTL